MQGRRSIILSEGGWGRCSRSQEWSLLKCAKTYNPECAKTYTDDNFRIIGQGRSSFHLSVLESVYIKTQNPVLCKQKDFIFSLGIFK